MPHYTDVAARAGFATAAIAMLGVAVIESGVAHAQVMCPDPGWALGSGLPGLDGTAYDSLVWDPDGIGPLGHVVIVGGSFAQAGSASAKNVAAYDPIARDWSALGDGLIGTVRCLAQLQTGEIVAGGSFSFTGPTASNAVGYWDGAQWQPLGSGMSSTAYAMTVLGDGTLVAARNSSLRAWDGVSWKEVGSPIDGSLRAVAELSGGQIVIGGVSIKAGGVAGRGVLIWDGASWIAPGGSRTSNWQVNSACALDKGEVLVGGLLSDVSGGIGTLQIARWDGAQWEDVNGTGLDLVLDMSIDSGGGIIASGQSFGNRVVVDHFDGLAWTPLEEWNTGIVRTISVLPSGTLLAAGGFSYAGDDTPALNVGLWNGADWSPAEDGFNSNVHDIAPLAESGVVVVGTFTQAAGTPAKHVALLDGAAWHPIGSGTDGFLQAVSAAQQNDIVVGGAFSTIDSVPAKNIAWWDGSLWNAMGDGLGEQSATGEYVSTIIRRSSGIVVAGGTFIESGKTTVNHIAEWDGMLWRGLGSGVSVGLGGSTGVHALVECNDRQLFAGGAFIEIGGVAANRVARWDGSAWHALGPGVTVNGSFGTPIVLALTLHPDGDLLAGGHFTHAGALSTAHIARWDGTQWHAMGSGVGGLGNQTAVHDLVSLPGERTLVVGSFQSAGGVFTSHMAVWAGSAWTPFVKGPDYAVVAAETLDGGDILVGGQFVKVSQACSAYFARYGCESSCYADCDKSGTLDFFDVLCFQSAFVSGNSYGDCDNNGQLTADDFACYLLMFKAGC